MKRVLGSLGKLNSSGIKGAGRKGQYLHISLDLGSALDLPGTSYMFQDKSPNFH